MADYEYQTLSERDRIAIADAQVTQFEREHFGHELNIRRLKAAGHADDDPAMTEAKAAREAIEGAIATTVEVAAQLAEAVKAEPATAKG